MDARPFACAGMEIGAPRVARHALIDVHDLLIALGFRRECQNDSKVVREDRDEVGKLGEDVSPKPVGDGVGHDKAARDEVRRSGSGDRAIDVPVIEAAGIVVTEENADDPI